MNEIRIPYKPNKIIFIVAMAFFGICAGFMAYVAATNDRGLTLNRMFEMSTQEATIFYWVIASAASAFVVIGALALINSFLSKREIIISTSSITSPKSGFSKIDVTVNFTDITYMTIQTIQKTQILNIDHSDGRLSIPNTMLSSKQAFEELVSQLQSKMNG